MNRASREPIVDVQQTSCCVVGGGPGGMMLALLLARAGVAGDSARSPPDLRARFPRRHHPPRHPGNPRRDRPGRPPAPAARTSRCTAPPFRPRRAGHALRLAPPAEDALPLHPVDAAAGLPRLPRRGGRNIRRFAWSWARTCSGWSRKMASCAACATGPPTAGTRSGHRSRSAPTAASRACGSCRLTAIQPRRPLSCSGSACRGFGRSAGDRDRLAAVRQRASCS